MAPLRVCLMASTVMLALPACSSGSGDESATPSVSTPPTAAITILAIGDSDTTGIGDPSGRGWAGRFGDLLHRKLSAVVHVDNRAVEGQTSDELRNAVIGDDALRQALAKADVVLVGTGGADLNAGDDALQANQCDGRACYRPILRRFGENISAIATEVHQLNRSALLRAISLPNGYPGAGDAIPPFITAAISRYESTMERALVCQAMQRNGGRCADVVRGFNGPSANEDAYTSGLMTKDPCCYPSGKGQQLMAGLLIKLGTDGLGSG
jgi:lysophospholipase L1-like esterase